MVARDRAIQQRVQYSGNGEELMYYGATFQIQIRLRVVNFYRNRTLYKERLKSDNRTSGISKKVKMNQSKVEGKESKRTPVSALSALLRKLKRVGYCYEFEG